MADIDKVLSCFEGNEKPRYGKDGVEYMVHCPCHYDKNSSLHITYNEIEDKILLHDFGGCSTERILADVGLSFSDLEPDKEEKIEPAWKKDLVAEYRFTDAKGRYLYSKLRYSGKVIRYCVRHGDKLQWGKADTASSLYNLPQLIRSIKDEKAVFVVEGEKDVDTLSAAGLTATTAGSVSDWKKKFSKYFIGANVIILADNDEPGKQLAEQISSDLSSVAFSRRVVIPSRIESGDVTDYFETEMRTKSDLLALVENAGRKYASWINDEGKKIKINAGLLASEIINMNNIMVARIPGFKSDKVYWYEHGAYREKSDAEMISEIIKYIPSAYQSAATLKNVADIIKFRAKCISYDDLNNNERFVNLKNGLLDTSSFELVKHDPKVYGTIQLDCRWDPDARAEKWCSFIADLCRDEDGNVDQAMIDVLQEWSGLFLSSVHGYRIKRALVFFSPQGNTGKSVFIGVLKSILGISNIANVPFQDMGSSRWATGRAFGKRLIVVGDQSAESVENSSVFKMLTGGDPVAAEFKGIQGFDYVFCGMMVIACNMLPAFDDDKGNHMSERLMFLNCRNVIPSGERDQFLLDKLCKEKDGIFRWAMVGLKRFIDNGYRFTECSSANDLMDRYRKRNDTLYAFIQEECLPGNNSDIIRKSKFEERYRQYCIDHEVTPLSPRNIQNRAASLGYALYSKDGYRVYRGLKFKDIPGAYGFVPLDDDEQIEFDDSGAK